MSAYSLALGFWLGALIAQLLVCRLSLEVALRRQAPTRARRLGVAFATASLLLALAHGHALELALHTGIFDFRQSLLSLLAALLQWLAGRSLARPATHAP